MMCAVIVLRKLSYAYGRGSPQYVTICISCDIKWPPKYAMGFCFNSSGLVLLRYQCCHNSSSFFHNVFQWLGNCLVSNFISMCISECKHSCWIELHFSFSWPLKCLMPKLMAAAPQRKSLTYLSVCNDVKMKYSSCKNARVQNQRAKVGYSWLLVASPLLT